MPEVYREDAHRLFPQKTRRGNATHAPQMETRLIKISKVGII